MVSLVRNVRGHAQIRVHRASRRQGGVSPVETVGLGHTASLNVFSASLAKYKVEYAQLANQQNGDPIVKTTARATVIFVEYTVDSVSNALVDILARTVRRDAPIAAKAFVVQQLEHVILAAKRDITELTVKNLVHPVAKNVVNMMGLAQWRNLLNLY